MKLSNIVPNTKFLSKKEEKALFEEYYTTPSLRRKKEIKDKLILNQCGQVINIASVYRESDNIEDLFQEGMIAVLESFNSYDYTHNASFTTYVRNGIFRQICDYLKRNRMIKLSQTALEKLKKINKAKDLLERLNQPVTTEAISNITKIKEHNVIEILNTLTVEELDRFVYGDSEKYSVLENLEDKSAEKEFDDVIDKLSPIEIDVSCLDQQEQDVITLIYYCNLTISQVSKRLNIKATLISDIKYRALKKLRKALSHDNKI